MANTVAEKIAWHRSPESRRWKRRVQFVELVFIAAMVVSACIGFTIHDGPKGLESVFYLFAGCLLLSTAMLGPFILRDESVSRYVRSFIILGLGSGAGCLAGFALTSMVGAA